jgi:hypothetical protein
MAVFSALDGLAVVGVCLQVFPGVSGITGEEVIASTPPPTLSSTTKANEQRGLIRALLSGRDISKVYKCNLYASKEN